MLARTRTEGAEWEPVHINATSAIQAEAIARRQCLDVKPDSVQPLKASFQIPDTQRQTNKGGRNLIELRCQSCNYLLDGLAIESGAVECPECGLLQRLFNLRPLVEPKWSNSGCAKFFVGALAAIGGLVVMLILLVILAAL